MSLEAIRQVMEMEQMLQARKSAVEAEARKMVANAEQEGQMLLVQTRAEAAKKGTLLLHQAEARGTARATEMMQAAEMERMRQQRQAEAQLDKAAEFIAERAVGI